MTINEIEDKTNEESKKAFNDEKLMEEIVIKIAEQLNTKKCQKNNCGSILVVDDNEFNRFILIQLLKKYKFNSDIVVFSYILGNKWKVCFRGI